MIEKNKKWTVNFNNHKLYNITLFLVSLFLVMVYLRIMTTDYGNYLYIKGNSESQYPCLAEALLHGHTYLDLNVSDKLLQLANPYDTYTRDIVLTRHVDYYWDYAFYNGKYYSYFGIVPCLLFYIPYYLITGSHLPNGLALLSTVAIFIYGVFSFLYQIIKKYFQDTPAQWYLFLCFFIICSSGLAIVLNKPNFYNIPIILGIGFTLIGLSLWLKSLNGNKLKKKYLFWGSLFMALVAGCRPQLLIISLTSFLIFKDYLKQYRKYLKEIFCFALPFLVVGLLIMAYNFIRFGSVFDFGAKYNLTTNDMTNRNFSIKRLIISLFAYLFEPMHFSNRFPFLKSFNLKTSFNGVLITEPLYGGFYLINFISLLGFLSFKFKKYFKDNSIVLLTVVFNILAFLILLIDSHVAGILPRYFNDFAFLLNISSSLVILAIINSKNLLKFRRILIILIGFSIFFNFLIIFI